MGEESNGTRYPIETFEDANDGMPLEMFDGE